MRKRLLPVVLSVLLLLSTVMPAFAAGNSTTPSSAPSASEESTETTSPPEEGTEEEGSSDFDDIKTTINTIMNVLLPGNWMMMLSDYLAQETVKLMDNVFPLITHSLYGAFFGEEIIRGLLTFFQWLAIILITCGVVARLMRVLDAVHHGEPANISGFVMDILKAYGLSLFCFPVIGLVNHLINRVTDEIIALAVGRTGVSFTAILTSAPEERSGRTILFLGLGIVTAIMLFRALRRMCTIFLQVVLGHLYAYDIVQGRPMLGEWGKDVIAGFLTFSFQMMFYRIGLELMTAGLRTDASVFSGDTVVGIALLVGVSVVPMSLRKFGQATPPGSFARGMGQAVSLGLSVARFAL